MSVAKVLTPPSPIPTLAQTLSRKAYRRSVESLSVYLADHPQAAAAYHNRAVALYHLDRREEAVADFARQLSHRL